MIRCILPRTHVVYDNAIDSALARRCPWHRRIHWQVQLFKFSGDPAAEVVHWQVLVLVLVTVLRSSSTTSTVLLVSRRHGAAAGGSHAACLALPLSGCEPEAVPA